MIYDLDNEYGGRVVADGDSENAALTVLSNATYVEALNLGRGIKGNATSAPLVFANLSGASLPLMDFGKNFISTASIHYPNGTLGQAEKWVVVRAGNINYGIPLFGLSTAVNGPGVY